MTKFRIGQKVSIKESYFKWVEKHIIELFSVGGVGIPLANHFEEIAVIALRKKYPLTNKIVYYHEGNKTYKVESTSEIGTFSCYYEAKDLKK